MGTKSVYVRCKIVTRILRLNVINGADSIMFVDVVVKDILFKEELKSKGGNPKSSFLLLTMIMMMIPHRTKTDTHTRRVVNSRNKMST